MLDIGVEQYDPDPVCVKRNIFVSQRLTVEADHMILFTKHRGELVHDTALYADKDILRKLLLDSISTFCVLFRHALILHGVEAKSKKREIVAGVQQAFGVDPAPFQKLLDVREKQVKPGALEPTEVLTSYLKQIAVVIDAVDRLEK